MTKAFIRPRPIRVAFLVDEHEHWRPMLDAVFAESYGRWGGRFSLIVPCQAREVRPAYLPWLEAYDADIIYSYVDLTEEAVVSLHERLYPSFLMRHEFYGHAERDVHAFRPHLPLSSLTSLSVTAVASRGSMIAGPQPVTLLDFYGRAPAPRFLQENFGCYRESLSPWPVPAILAPYVRTVALVEPELVQNPQLVPRPQGDFVTDYRVVLNRIATQRDLCGLALLSAWLCPRLQMHDPRWTNRVNLIVGDSFADRLTFWNARSHLAVWLDNSLVTLKMSKSDIEDPDLFTAITSIIRNRIHVSAGSSNNSHITVRSATHTQEELDQIVAQFRQADQWNIYSSDRIESVDACAPNLTVLTPAQRHVDEGAPFRSSDWHEITFSEESFRPPLIAPRHIRDVPSLPALLNRGAWALDLDMQRTIDYSRFQNVQHHWRLPRRLRMTSAFCRAYQLGGSQGPLCVPRANEQGLLTLLGVTDGQLPELMAPTDESAFAHALCSPRDWLPFAHGRGPLANSIYFEIRPSDKGRYLTALMRLSDGIHRAREIFLKKFWKEQFERLGASPSAGEDRLPDLVRRLQNRLRSGAIANQEDWERIARVVVTEARSIRLAPRYLRFDRLAERFDDFRNAFWATHEAATPRDEWDEEERQSLARSVKYLCEQEVLHQGYEWRCRRCNNNNWVSVDSLRQTMTCEVCGAAEPAPVSDSWNFKLNSFVLEGLRDHGLLAYIWCLARLSDQAHASFFFLEPHELFFTTNSAYTNRPDAEVDLIAVVDGVVRLCEAKSSNQSIDLEKFARLARQVRPDIATLAIMEPRSNSTDRRLADLQRLLVDTQIGAEVLTLEDQDIDNSPNLPTGRSFLVRLL
jgi:hypothetical protein